LEDSSTELLHFELKNGRERGVKFGKTEEAQRSENAAISEWACSRMRKRRRQGEVEGKGTKWWGSGDAAGSVTGGERKDARLSTALGGSVEGSNQRHGFPSKNNIIGFEMTAAVNFTAI